MILSYSCLIVSIYLFFDMNRMKTYLYIIVLCLFSLKGIAQTIQGTYAIKNTQTGLVLRVQDARKANGTPIVSYSPVNWKCVTWDFVHIDGNAYQLRNLFTNKTLQPLGGTLTEGTSLEQQPMVAAQKSQIYEFIPVTKDTYRIRLQGTELYITPSEDAASINSKVILAPKTGSKNQLWTIYEQHPEI